MDERRLDGNAAAGLLAQLFTFDPTTAATRCGGCGQTGPIASLLLYGGAMGTILRCPGCDHPQLRLVVLEGRYLLDLGGVSVLEVVT